MKDKHSQYESEEELQDEEALQNEEITETNTEIAQEKQDDDWEQKYNKLNDTHLRLIAEFDNYRKRTLREKADLMKSAGESILTNLLPVIDDFERAIKAIDNAEDINSVKEGIDLIYNKLKSFLTQNGVKEIETENQPFNVDLHEAITTIPAPSEELKGKIIDCVSKGYTLNDKVIRFPKVVVGE